jgi:hypothetical protein
MYLTKDVLIQVLSEAAEKGKTLGKTRLIKFLYLTEVEYCREIGERLTDLKWLFYRYGPYAFELESILAEREFQRVEIKTPSDQDATLFRIAEQLVPFSRKVDTKLSLIIKMIVGHWIDKTFAELLDYVYFQTEPMLAVDKRGQILDFTTVKKESQSLVVPLKASSDTQLRVAELRKRIGATLKRLAEQRASGREIGKEYHTAMGAWEQDLDKEFDPETLKRISLTVTRPANDTGKQGN